MLSRYDYFAQDPDFPAVLIIGTLFLGAFFGFLNETLLNVALTHIMHYFSIDKSTVQWMTTGFLLIMGALTPITANVIQWFSTRTTALLTLGIFLTGTVICAFAPNFPVLLAGRLIQAIGAAIQIPLLISDTAADECAARHLPAATTRPGDEPGRDDFYRRPGHWPDLIRFYC